MEPSWIRSHRRVGYGKEILFPRFCSSSWQMAYRRYFVKLEEVHQAKVIRDLISTYAQATGQLINMEKCSSIMFGRGCLAPIQEEIRATLQLQNPEFEANLRPSTWAYQHRRAE
jgi:hypothetical protein